MPVMITTAKVYSNLLILSHRLAVCLCKSKYYLSILVLTRNLFFRSCMFVLKEHNIGTSGIGYEIRAY